jgi:hypothetical protein
MSQYVLRIFLDFADPANMSSCPYVIASFPLGPGVTPPSPQTSGVDAKTGATSHNGCACSATLHTMAQCVLIHPDTQAPPQKFPKMLC